MNMLFSKSTLVATFAFAWALAVRADALPNLIRNAGFEKPGAKPGASAWAEWTGAGFEFGAAVLLFFLLGSFLDARWGTQPWLTVAGAFVGIVAGTYLLIRPALRSKPTDKPPRELKRP